MRGKEGARWEETNEIHRQYNLAQRVLFSPAQLILFYLKIRGRESGRAIEREIESPRKLASFILACSLDARAAQPTARRAAKTEFMARR